MRAVRLHSPGIVELDRVPDPEATRGTVLVEMRACGICGSDLHFVDGTARPAHTPITLGHEIAGVVSFDPSGAFTVGDRVAAEVGRFCGECRRCAEGRVNLCERAVALGIHVDGGLADLVAVPMESLVPIPEGVATTAAATAVDAGATALHAIERRAAVKRGETVLIVGAGGLGTYAVQLARRAGAGAVLVADTDRSALKRATELGADETVLVEAGQSTGRAVKLLSDGGVDAALEFVGSADAAQDAVKSIRPGGRAVVVGVGPDPITTLPPVLWSNNEYTLTGSYGSLPGDAATILRLLAEGAITPPPVIETALEDVPGLMVELAGGSTIPGRAVAVVGR